MSKRRLAWVVVVALLAAGALGLGASTVLAQVALTPTPNPLPGSNFQGGDGNQVDQGGHLDWQGLQAAGLVGHTMDLPSGTTDDSFTQGSEELHPGGWVLTHSPVTPKDDILDVYRGFEHQTGHDAFLYLAFTREHGTGTTFLTFELNQRAEPWRDSNGIPIPCRETGDVLISFIQHGNNEADTTAYVQEWVTTASDPATGCATNGTLQSVTDLRPDVDVQAAFNATSITNYLPGQLGSPIDTFKFGEAAINLTTVLGEMGESCSDTNFFSIWAHSRASDTITSEMKDYVSPQRFFVSVCKRHPRLRSTTSPIVTLGHPIFDTAILRRAAHATGTLTFQLYGPNDRRCSRPAIHTFTTPEGVVNGNGQYNSDSFTPTQPGTYRWRVTYSGDANYYGAGPTRCRASSETVRVTRAQTMIGTEASGTTVLPNPIHDTAFVTGGESPTGTVTFEVFNPHDPNCSTPVHTFSSVPLTNGTATSPDFTPTEAGTWRWIATYSGDAHNARAATLCNEGGESTVVDEPTAPPRGRPTITTTATPSGPAGSPIVDTAHLTGGTNPTGTITFFVYGPNNSSCTGAPAAPLSTVTVSGAGSYTSAPFTPTDPGTYYWIAHYSGDANNDPAATTCNESGENSVVSKATPGITTSASPATAPYGSAVGDTAVLTGGADPRGTITFRLYGPNDGSCSGPPAFVVGQEVIGNGSYSSPMPTPTLAGTYRWVATYSGDARNNSVSTHCGDPGESVVVEAPPPIPPTPDEPTPKPKPTPTPKPKPPTKPTFTG